MIRWLINVRYAVHYGLNSDIARGPKSAKAQTRKSRLQKPPKEKPPEGGFQFNAGDRIRLPPMLALTSGDTP
jgi:hypothetical protein